MQNSESTSAVAMKTSAESTAKQVDERLSCRDSSCFSTEMSMGALFFFVMPLVSSSTILIASFGLRICVIMSWVQMVVSVVVMMS